MADVKVAALVASVKNAPGLHYKNPRFPLNVKLPDNLECGSKIYIHGCAAAEPNRFAINLKNAETDANNYFHFNPRFDEGCVVRNSRLDEAWGDEEREGDMPFAPGQPFLITIIPTVDCYEVEVNGSPFIKYGHREGMPLCDVTHIAMWGDVTIYGIHVPLRSLPIPLALRIPKHTFYGDMLILTGTVAGGADRFHVNFQCGAGEDADIMYHFNPRFPDNQLVCNNRCADTWGEEQTIDGLPVAPGDRVVVCIVAAKEGFIPFLNGNPLPTFPHRLDVCGACSIVVDGDISLESVTVDCPPVRLPAQIPDIDIDAFDDKTVQALRATTPVTMTLPAGFGPGKGVHVSGKVHDSPSRFEINLQCGESDSDIAIHFNPRFEPVHELVMNSRNGGNWEEELREENPIAPGSEVDIYILCLEDSYVCVVDGDVVANFPHRFDSGRVTHVNVDGSITVYRMLGM
ncbi:32 kDa beta-galactoside-binding lectin like protein [Argiope bruennichi]|uniref:Galectin n=1 Tax=Argiope bruennichi TaxID=94029 RepID=A0A8T0EN93_ARGBR|nr:32 kDa beta-galactoside-binding lectin like protein [Argiope bruennichi]